MTNAQVFLLWFVFICFIAYLGRQMWRKTQTNLLKKVKLLFKANIVIWITGKSNAGKTTLAYQLAGYYEEIGARAIVLDGDEIRNADITVGFSDDERRKHIMTTAGFASILQAQGIAVIVALLSPKKKWRNEARRLFSKSILIYVNSGRLWEGTIYDVPDKNEFDVFYDWRQSKVEFSGEKVLASFFSNLLKGK